MILIYTGPKYLNTGIVNNKYLFLFPFAVFVLLPFSSYYNFPLIIMVLAGLWFTLSRFREITGDPRVRIFIVLFLCIFVPMLISTIDAIQPDETFRKVLGFALYLFFGIAIIRVAFPGNLSRIYFINATGVLLLLWSTDALWQYVHGSNILGYPYEKGRLTSLFYPSFSIGIVMAIMSPFYFEFIRRLNQKFNISWILIIPFVLVILLSGSRTSWVMLLISVLLYGAYYFRASFYRGITWQYVVLGLVVLGILIIAMHMTKPELFNNISSQISSRIAKIRINTDKTEGINALELRVQIWERGLRIFSEHWLNGVGVRGFRYIDKEMDIDSKSPVISKVATSSTHPHQITLEIMVETGLIGLTGYVIFLLVLISIYHEAWKNRIHKDDLFWCIPVFVATFPLNMHKSFYGHFSSVIIWVLVAIAVANMSVLQPANRDSC